jgi:protein-disulfide isomerase
MKKIALALILPALLLLLYACEVGKPAKKLAANAVKVELYVMSQCPFGVQAENGVLPALQKLDTYVDFHLDYIVTQKGEGEFNSLHGPNEVAGNIAQLCVKEKYPDKFFDFLDCQNKNYRDVQNNWKACAEKLTIDAAKLTECKDGQEGKKLLAASALRSAQAKAEGSPTIKVNGKPYNSSRRGADDFVRAICNEMTGEKPQACAGIQPPPPVELMVLNDSRCKECARMEGFVQRLQDVFPGLTSKKIDYSSEEGKNLYKEAGLKYLPAFLFTESVEKDKDGYKNVANFLEQKGKYRQLKLGADFDPTAEICDNKIDDTGDGKIDCDDETCKEDLLCRSEAANRLDVFVMSQCPYGVQALNAMDEVLKNFEKKIEFNVHYLAEKTEKGFQSLHGQAEVDENIRELCAIKYYPKQFKYMDYVWCRNKGIKSAEWKECTGKNGIDAAKLEKCATGEEGQKIFEENIKLGKALKINSSPTWLANNRYKFSGADPETIKKNLCKYNPTLKNCDKTLSGPAAGGKPQGACGK